jgi:small subunit ribosomal protein S25e
MGGAKKKSPSQQEKSQKNESEKKSDAKKKGKKKEKPDTVSKSEISVIVNQEQAAKFLKNAKVITVQEMARQTGVKISAANAYLLKLLQNGEVKRVGGHSGHHVYQPVSA